MLHRQMSPLNGSKNIPSNDLRLLNQPKQEFIHLRYGFSKSGVPPNSVLFGGTVPPNSVLFGGAVPPNSFPQKSLVQIFSCDEQLKK